MARNAASFAGFPVPKKRRQSSNRVKTLMASALKNITQLYQYDPSSVVDFSPIIQTFANINEEQAQDLAKIRGLWQHHRGD
ncbi:unnamed protein product [Sphagnum jensenii]|uniref:Uncharacterized protein n=1 Tax=Sphagnum jensenii TaxID=128206 RepID=A0ABP0V7S9_9BRYO